MVLITLSHTPIFSSFNVPLFCLSGLGRSAFLVMLLLLALMQSDVDRDGLRRGATVEHLFDGGGGEMARERAPGDEH